MAQSANNPSGTREGELPAPPALGHDSALFLDFDGTLVDIADAPDEIDVSPGLPGILADLAIHLDGALAIISGRTIAELDRYLTPHTLPIAGVHGAEWRLPDGTYAPVSQDIQQQADAIAQALEPLARTRGLIVEAKPGAVALHYRQAPDSREDCERAMLEALEDLTGWTMLHGKMVIEARRRDVSKAGAITRLMDHRPFSGRTPVFIGDDRTDEDGFRAVNAADGISIKVGAGSTIARHRLAGVSKVRRYLAAATESLSVDWSLQ
ncbi:trehalose-phosphatase [Cucumibacter marinus]|uniref:trehalose-phosphatase n=1 Tax=Cucumibacter marinus TaxID=1121252 RepID=UPI0003FA0173|nr:trehalose-phosphatase [Cucumibacter marinus]